MGTSDRILLELTSQQQSLGIKRVKVPQTDIMNIDSAVDRLRAAEKAMRENPPDSIKDKKSALDEYRLIFQLDEVATITEQDFRDFLLYENNRHWTGLHRKRSMMTEDMGQLRDGLQTLVDTDWELASRVQYTKENVDGMGKATISAILLTAYPEKYGVWNNRSEEALKQLGIWPEFEYGDDFGQRYERVNKVLEELGAELGLDFWDLDALLGYLVEAGERRGESPDTTESTGEFVKERHLQQYLVNNWDRTEMSDEWDIYSDADDPEAGVEFSTGIGRPDILLTHKSDPRVCVLELKKGGTSDSAVGQLLRYVGWIRKHLGELESIDENADVEGRLIVSESSEKLGHAISAAPELTLYQYEMEVDLIQEH